MWYNILGENMINNLKVLYEDNHIIVVLKPANVLSQEDSTKDLNMLNMVKAYIKEKYSKPGNVYVGLVHRLDRMTSGVMVFAKTSKGASRLNEQIRNNQMEKKYLALVEGITPENGTLINYLYKNEEMVKSFVTEDKNRGKYSELRFETQKQGKNQSLVDIRLITGRHHQIRVQFASRGHSLLGDQRYGKQDKTKIVDLAKEGRSSIFDFSYPLTDKISKEQFEQYYPNGNDEFIALPNGRYLVLEAESDNGRLDGNWTIDKELIYEKEGGHGMIFTATDSKDYCIYHSPNETPLERPVIDEIDLNKIFSKRA